MKTIVDADAALLAEVVRITGITEPDQAAEHALRQLIASRNANGSNRSVHDPGAKISVDDDCDPKKAWDRKV